MLNYIRHLRTKPEEVKKQIVMLALVVCMSIVVVIWLTTLGVKNTKEKETKPEEEKAKSPFSILTGSFTETFKGIKTSVSEMDISGLKKELEESSEDETNLNDTNKNFINE